jgi:AmmeMemoRadiSam system protein B
MKKEIKIKSAVIMLGFMLFFGFSSEEIRPIRDDVGYCWKKQQIADLINFLKKQEDEKSVCPHLVAGIFPHDDYLYAAPVYYPLFKQIKSKEVLIFGVTHGTVRKEINDPNQKLIFDNYRFWQGPIKKVPISPLREFLKQNLSPQHLMISDLAHRLEHSIEAAIPFLQYFNPDIQLTPIMVTGMSFDQMESLSDEISKLITIYIRKNNLEIGKDIFFLISSDANHYGEDFDNTIFGTDARAHEQATSLDKNIIDSCLINQISEDKIKQLTMMIWGKTYRDFKNTLWCGKYSIPFGLLTILKIVKNLGKNQELTGTLFRYSDTYSGGVLPLKKSGYGITAPFSLKHWVGFFSAGFCLE